MNPWISPQAPGYCADLRLFCFPHAGGSAFLFRDWQERLPAYVEVCPVQLPGRGPRLSELPYRNIARLVKDLAADLRPSFEQPFCLFGHSLGALIAFELARHLRERYQVQPQHLFAAGRKAPQLGRDVPPIHDLPEPEFLRELAKLNGTPADVLAHKELLRLMLPALRADFQMVETYEFMHQLPLDCPITVFGGLSDASVTSEALQAWQEQTTSLFDTVMLPGDHFFLNLNTTRHSLIERLSLDLYRV